MGKNIILFVGGVILGFIFILIYEGSSFWFNLSQIISPKTVDDIHNIILIVVLLSLTVISIFLKKHRFLSIGLLFGIILFFCILFIGWKTPMF